MTALATSSALPEIDNRPIPEHEFQTIRGFREELKFLSAGYRPRNHQELVGAGAEISEYLRYLLRFEMALYRDRPTETPWTRTTRQTKQIETFRFQIIPVPSQSGRPQLHELEVDFNDNTQTTTISAETKQALRTRGLLAVITSRFIEIPHGTRALQIFSKSLNDIHTSNSATRLEQNGRHSIFQPLQNELFLKQPREQHVKGYYDILAGLTRRILNTTTSIN